ncbi:MAG: hypothetical protein V4542_06645 [Pseudomonadota bacterium]
MTELIAGDVDGVLPVNRLVFEQTSQRLENFKGFLERYNAEFKTQGLKELFEWEGGRG